MEATINRVELLKTLGRLRGLIPNRSSLPIITRVAISAIKGKIELRGTDLNVFVTSSCKADVSKDWAICVPIKTLEPFLKHVKAETATMTMPDKTHLKIKAGASITLEGVDIADFPNIQVIKKKFCSVVNLDQALKEVSYAASGDQDRPVLTGISFIPGKGNLEICSADGFRLAITTIEAKMSKGVELKPFIMPKAATNIIEKYMPGNVEIFKAEETMSFVNNGTVMTAMLIQGSYPNYKQVIPKIATSFTFDSEGMKNALGIISATLGITGIVRLRTKKGELVVSSFDKEDGGTSTTIPSTGKCKVAVNVKYIKDVLNRIKGAVKASTNMSGSAPVLIKHKDTIHVIMPMFVQW